MNVFLRHSTFYIIVSQTTFVIVFVIGTALVSRGRLLFHFLFQLFL